MAGPAAASAAPAFSTMRLSIRVPLAVDGLFIFPSRYVTSGPRQQIYRRLWISAGAGQGSQSPHRPVVSRDHARASSLRLRHNRADKAERGAMATRLYSPA